MAFILALVGVLMVLGVVLFVAMLYISWLILCSLAVSAAALGGGIGWLLTQSQEGLVVGALSGPVVLVLLATAIDRRNRGSTKG